MHVTQRGITGAEIVQRRLDAGVPQSLQHLGHRRGIAEQRAFGDLDAQLRGIESGLVGHGQQARVEILVLEVPWRDVDGDEAAIADQVQTRGAGHAIHLPVDRLDLTTLLGHAQEFAGQQHAALRMVPTHQRLVADDPGVGKPHQRLEVRFELAGRQRGAQFVLQTEHIHRVALQRFVEHHETMAAGALGAVQRDIGITQQLVGRVVALIADRDADAGRGTQLVVVDQQRLPQRLEHPLGNLACGLRDWRILQQHCEFIA